MSTVYFESWSSAIFLSNKITTPKQNNYTAIYVL